MLTGRNAHKPYEIVIVARRQGRLAANPLKCLHEFTRPPFVALRALPAPYLTPRARFALCRAGCAPARNAAPRPADPPLACRRRLRRKRRRFLPHLRHPRTHPGRGSNPADATLRRELVPEVRSPPPGLNQRNAARPRPYSGPAAPNRKTRPLQVALRPERERRRLLRTLLGRSPLAPRDRCARPLRHQRHPHRARRRPRPLPDLPRRRL